MAHFAKIENGTVTEVLVVANEHEHRAQEYLNELGIEGTFIQTSYNANFRKNFAGIGFTYDKDKDAFISPQPFSSWVLDEDTCKWQAPIAMPNDGQKYLWDEDNTSWILANTEA